jgi:adenylate kinase family enzyme
MKKKTNTPKKQLAEKPSKPLTAKELTREEYAKEYYRKYYKRNRAVLLKRSLDWYRDNKKKALKRLRKYNKEHAAELQSKARAKYAAAKAAMGLTVRPYIKQS